VRTVPLKKVKEIKQNHKITRTPKKKKANRSTGPGGLLVGGKGRPVDSNQEFSHHHPTTGSDGGGKREKKRKEKKGE